jgi:hypothetical protein
VSAYDSVWQRRPGALPIPTGPEAIAGARLLYREAFRFLNLPVEAKRPRRFKLASGNRHTWPRRGVYYVNPDYRWRHGWEGIVHSISHWAWNVKHRHRNDVRPHDPGHVAVERHLAEFVIDRGFLDGKLKRPEKPKPTVDTIRAHRKAAAEAKLKRWQSKAKRAETAMRKLKKTLAYYETMC